VPIRTILFVRVSDNASVTLEINWRLPVKSTVFGSVCWTVIAITFAGNRKAVAKFKKVRIAVLKKAKKRSTIRIRSTNRFGVHANTIDDL
jgi:hypothetical protein